MYKVTKRQPNRVISEEYYANKLNAMLRRDMINATCKNDECTGATMEAIAVSDLIGIDYWKVEIPGLTQGAVYNSAGLELVIDSDLNHIITFDIENQANPEWGQSKFECFHFCFHDYETQTDYENIEMGQDTLDELNKLVSGEMEEEVEKYALN